MKIIPFVILLILAWWLLTRPAWLDNVEVRK
jgi:hypothetical protein